jgi:hypothetical protein
MGTGDPDLYKAFAWRNSGLLRPSGAAGLVLPRSSMTSKGSAIWRQELVRGGRISNLTSLVNAGNWVFENVDGRYQVALIVINGSSSKSMQFAGPYYSREEFSAKSREGMKAAFTSIEKWNGECIVPMFDSQNSVDIFNQISDCPTLGQHPDFEYRPVAEVSASLDKKKFYFENDKRPDDALVVYGGRSFDVWNSDTGEYFGWAKVATLNEIKQKRKRQVKLKTSAFYGLGDLWALDDDLLPFKFPRIAFRDITRSSDSRTVRVALVPPNVILNNKAPYLFRVRGDERTDSFLLGVLSSMIFDWSARQIVELGLNPSLFLSLHVPRYDVTNELCKRISYLSTILATKDKRYLGWANANGVLTVEKLVDANKDDLIAENDALVAHMFGLTRTQLEHVFKTFHRGWDYAPRLEKVLSFFDKLPKAKP